MVVAEPRAIQLISVLPGGVVHYSDSHLPRPVVVRVEQEHDGRLSIVELLVPRGGPVTTDQLRQVPLGRIDAWANGPMNRETILASLSLEPVSLEDAASLVAESDAAAIDRATNRRRKRSLRIQKPEGAKYPDSFYQRVAELYLDLAASGGRPAAAIAEANAVPTTTVHRWIRQARDRGFLHKGRAGRAG